MARESVYNVISEVQLRNQSRKIRNTHFVENVIGWLHIGK